MKIMQVVKVIIYISKDNGYTEKYNSIKYNMLYQATMYLQYKRSATSFICGKLIFSFHILVHLINSLQKVAVYFHTHQHLQ